MKLLMLTVNSWYSEALCALYLHRFVTMKIHCSNPGNTSPTDLCHDEAFLKVRVNLPCGLRSLGTSLDGPRPHLVWTRREEVLKIEGTVASLDDPWEGARPGQEVSVTSLIQNPTHFRRTQ